MAGRAELKTLLAGLALVMAGGLAAAPAMPGDPSGYVWAIPAWLPPPPVPQDNPMSADKVELGRHLFYDSRLSLDGRTACASCHEQARGFTDGRARALGAFSTEGHRNAMALANVGYSPVLTWANPNLRRLEFQALLPMFGQEPMEMGLAGMEQEVFGRLGKDPVYRRLFAVAFPERGGTIDLFAVTRAIAAFERTLISADSPYDRFKYGGDASGFSDAAKRGEELFFSHRLECYHCHAGFNFTDTFRTSKGAFDEVAFHNTGLYDVDGRGAYPAHGEGAAQFTGKAAQTGAFRTQSLRNIAVTAPYFHDGSAATLDEVIDHYAAGGRTLWINGVRSVGSANPYKDSLVGGFTLSPGERADLIAFLESLTDSTFLANPAFADPWPEDHPARASRRMPDS